MTFQITPSTRMNELTDKVVQWAYDRNLVHGSDPKSQLLKTMSELGELADGVNKQREHEIKDGIGDVLVTLIIVAEQCGMTMDECLAEAWEGEKGIKDRKGKMVNGVFIKEGDV